MKMTTTGSTSTTIAIVAAKHGGRKPMLPLSDNSSGTRTMPPQVAPLKARLSASPRRRSNQAFSTVAITTVPMPVQPTDISA